MSKYIKEDLEKAKQELKDYIYEKRWIDERLEDIKERKSLLDNITSTLSDMPKGSKQVYEVYKPVMRSCESSNS